jgi:hypothetical protein
MLGLARKLNLLASGGSVTLSYTLRRSARARRIYACIAAAARSCLIDVHLHCVVDFADGVADGSHQPCSCSV